MDKQNASLVKRMGEKIKKFLILIITFIITFTGIGIYTIRDYGIGYKYYQNNTVIGITQEKGLLTQTIESHIDDLETQGYVITSYEFNDEIFVKTALIRKSKADTAALKSLIIDNLTIEVFATQVSFINDTNTYIFTSESECRSFAEQIKSYTNTEGSFDSSIVNYKDITKKEVLDAKVNAVKAEKEKADALAAAKKKQEQAKKYQVTSRGGNVSRAKSSSNVGSILASYSYISSQYGMRKGKMHTGTDFAAPAGTHIYSWKSGTVTYAGWNGSYGNFIEVKHDDGTISRYAHLSGYAISNGASVSKGQLIGYVGTTGNSTGNHLHFEIKVNGNFVNPLNYL